MPAMEVVGRVAGFFAQRSVAAIHLTASLRVGETVYINGHTTDMRQLVESLQLNHQPVQEAGAGQTVGLKVLWRCRTHDTVYKLLT